MRPRFTLITNEQYLDQLEKNLSAAKTLRDEAKQSHHSKSALYGEKLNYKVKLNQTFDKLKAAEKGGKTISQGLANTNALSNFSREKIGYTLTALGSLAADTYEMADSTETLIADIKQLIEFLKNVENAEELKANLDKLLAANEEALTSAIATMQKTMQSYQGLLQLAAYFYIGVGDDNPLKDEALPKLRTGNLHVDSLGDIGHSIRYMTLQMKEYLSRFDEKLGTNKKGAVKDLDEDLFDILQHNLKEAETDVSNCLVELNKKDREYKDADASYKAIEASLNAAKAANAAAEGAKA